MKYVNIIHRALLSHDPNDILKRALPEDAYESEAKKISQQLPCCKHPHDLKKVIHSIFVAQFSLTEAGHERDYWELANELWSDINEEKNNSRDLSSYQSVTVQQWEESERGWGTRPDGLSIHLTDRDRLLYIKRCQDDLPEEVPHEYSRPFGKAFHALAPIEIYSLVDQSAHDCVGIRYFHHEIEICKTKNGTRYLHKKS